MKKKYFIYATAYLLTCALFTGCGSAAGEMPETAADAGTASTASTAAEAPAEDSAGTETLRDCTVTPPVAYEVNGEMIRTEESEPELLVAPTYENLVRDSSAVVVGTIQNVTYTSVEGTPWTQVDVAVEDSQYGALQSGDVISVYELGGYMPLEEFIAENDLQERFSDLSQEEIADTILFQNGGSQTTPEVGQTFLYFLTEAGGSLPEGAYERTCGTDNSQFVLEDGQYTCSGEWNGETVTFSAETMENDLAAKSAVE